MTTVHVAPANSVRGAVHLPGDKSMSHRALLLALVSTRPVRIENLALGDDVAATLAAVEQLGARVERDADDATIVTVTGVGLRGIEPPADGSPIDCRNAGTLARLLSGLLVGQPAGRTFTLVGDESLSSRPMARIAEPLTALGADIVTTAGGTLPLTITSVGELKATSPFELTVASAQVQSAILLAGLYANGRTTVVEPAVLRDHTERMLRRCGVGVHRRGRKVSVEPVRAFELPDTHISSDPSSAAPLVTAATLLHGSVVRLPGVIESVGRRGFLDTLDQMGARIGVSNRHDESGEPVADLEIQHSTVSRTFIEVEDVARMIDELPLLALVGHFRRGEFVVRGAEELRAKESNRIDQLGLAFKSMGVSFQPLRDGYIVRGSSVRPDGGRMDAAGDHRLAMLGGVVGLGSRHGVTIENAECVDISFPGFFDVLEALAVRA
ncbi:MAG: 3-phosphoshikimate 1-carboxyvinyltransferase [Thermoleophilia bacterium]|nr:3-phosphoshikimate 1-carboxyvinyltransferase [Thermoleophilia bacterium]